MKNIKKIKSVLMLFSLCLIATTSFGQIYEGDFNWVSLGTTSTTTITDCGGTPIDVTLTTDLNHNLLGAGRAVFPAPSNTAGDVLVTLTFSQPVDNLSLLINDLDELGSGGVGGASGGALESISSFSTPFFDLTAIGGSPLYAITGPNTGLDPDGAENTKGWVNWNVPITTISFISVRDLNPGDGAAVSIDSLKFDCEPALSCACETEGNALLGLGEFIDPSGTTTVSLQLNSNGEAVSTLNVSIPSYNSLVDPACFMCDPAGFSSYGHIVNLPTIAGVTPSFTGISTSSSTQIKYEFPVPTVVNETISLGLKFPPILALSCCNNSVDFCVNVQFIDADCNLCELYLCNSSEHEQLEENRRSFTEGADINPDGVNLLKTENMLNIYPNPTDDFIHIQAPVRQGTVLIYTTSGELVNEATLKSNQVQIDISNFEDGTYFVRIQSENQSYNGQFVKN